MKSGLFGTLLGIAASERVEKPCPPTGSDNTTVRRNELFQLPGGVFDVRSNQPSSLSEARSRDVRSRAADLQLPPGCRQGRAGAQEEWQEPDRAVDERWPADHRSLGPEAGRRDRWPVQAGLLRGCQRRADLRTPA